MSFKAGFVGLIGQPNAGKSSLMNFLIKEKVSIVTPKPQTTRRRILGLHTEQNKGQIVFVDAPGLIKSTSGLNSFLQKEAEEVIQSSDALLAVLSIDESDPKRNQEIIDLVSKSRKPWYAVITKTDIQDKFHRVLILKDMVAQAGVESAMAISLLKPHKEDREILIDKLIQLLPESEKPLYDTELYTTENMRQLCEEIVREKCFELLNHEIPYQIATLTRHFEENAKPCPKIYIDILVAKESQKPIVVGKGAEVIKKIGLLARTEIEKMMGLSKVYLELNVVVKDNWFEQKNMMKDLKYVSQEKKSNESKKSRSQEGI